MNPFTNKHKQTPQLLIDPKASLHPSIQQFDSATNSVHNYLQFVASLLNCQHLNSCRVSFYRCRVSAELSAPQHISFYRCPYTCCPSRKEEVAHPRSLPKAALYRTSGSVPSLCARGHFSSWTLNSSYFFWPSQLPTARHITYPNVTPSGASKRWVSQLRFNVQS